MPLSLSKLNPLRQGWAFLCSLFEVTTFVGLLLLYIIAKLVVAFFKLPLFPRSLEERLTRPLRAVHRRLGGVLELKRGGTTISRTSLIDISLRNMAAKKTRTLVTVGGMTIGIGSIVFLVSLGYGLQHLVVTRVARLEEMRQANIMPQASSKLRLTDASLSEFTQISGVEEALPMIAVVGRVNYQNSISDLAVYGVTSEFLRQSAIRPLFGQIFENNRLSTENLALALAERPYQDVREGEIGDLIQEVEVRLKPGEWLTIRESPSPQSRILGYSKGSGETLTAQEVWGARYSGGISQPPREETDEATTSGRQTTRLTPKAGEAGRNSQGEVIGKWLKASLPLWTEKKCDPTHEGECEEAGYLLMRGEDGKQKTAQGYFAQIGLEFVQPNSSLAGAQATGSQKESGYQGVVAPAKALSLAEAEARALASQSATLAVTETDEGDWVEIESENLAAQTPNVKVVQMPQANLREAVVNQVMLKVLGIDEAEAVGKKFDISFVMVDNLLDDNEKKIESAPIEYTIVGVVPEEKTPILYVPFVDLRSLGINNFSQTKIVVKSADELAKVRSQVEAMGFLTTSVSDTIEQINSLFVTAKALLALLGMIALSVAALGMFNTLTVSLLERTREVGLLKAMGMRSSEVRELFLSESMIMGLAGGVFGLLLGVAAGKLVSTWLSFIAMSKGDSLIDISYTPPFVVVTIILLSLLVGIMTGLYPARRATRISALNALRYE